MNSAAGARLDSSRHPFFRISCFCSRLMCAGADAFRPLWARRRLNLSVIRLRSEKLRCEASEKPGGLPRRKVGGRIANSIEGVVHDGRNASSAMRSGSEQEPFHTPAHTKTCRKTLKKQQLRAFLLHFFVYNKAVCVLFFYSS